MKKQGLRDAGLFLVSAVAVHVVVIFLVFARGDVVDPVLVVEVPFHRLLDAFLKL